MSLFLLTFRKGTREPPTLRRFEDPELAMGEFTAAERRHRELADDLGVVLLIADDEDTLRRTHAHYFASVAELLAPLSR